MSTPSEPMPHRLLRSVLGWAIFAVLWAAGQYFFLDRDRSLSACLVEGAILATLSLALTPLVEMLLRRWRSRSSRPDAADDDGPA